MDPALDHDLNALGERFADPKGAVRWYDFQRQMNVLATSNNILFNVMVPDPVLYFVGVAWCWNPLILTAAINFFIDGAPLFTGLDRATGAVMGDLEYPSALAPGAVIGIQNQELLPISYRTGQGGPHQVQCIARNTSAGVGVMAARLVAYTVGERRPQ